eukprot:109176_1
MGSSEAEPELHVIGEFVGGTGFDFDNAFGRFQFVAGESWELVGGQDKGQTQVDYPKDGMNFIWNHPIDLHYYLKAVQGWPKALIEVWHLDPRLRNVVHPDGRGVA